MGILRAYKCYSERHRQRERKRENEREKEREKERKKERNRNRKRERKREKYEVLGFAPQAPKRLENGRAVATSGWNVFGTPAGTPSTP